MVTYLINTIKINSYVSIKSNTILKLYVIVTYLINIIKIKAYVSI